MISKKSSTTIIMVASLVLISETLMVKALRLENPPTMLDDGIDYVKNFTSECRDQVSKAIACGENTDISFDCCSGFYIHCDQPCFDSIVKDQSRENLCKKDPNMIGKRAREVETYCRILIDS